MDNKCCCVYASFGIFYNCLIVIQQYVLHKHSFLYLIDFFSYYNFIYIIKNLLN